MAGKREEAIKALEELEEISKRTYVPPYTIGLIYAALGETPQAVEWLEKAYAAQNAWLNWLKVAPEVDSLRSDHRLTDLLMRLNLVPDKSE
jgi:tetratricopeptide (TPR) repeat protein